MSPSARLILKRTSAKVLMPAQDQFWGDRTARIIAPAGHVWTIASRLEETTEEQRSTRWADIRKGHQ
jgi:PhnB protein